MAGERAAAARRLQPRSPEMLPSPFRFALLLFALGLAACGPDPAADSTNPEPLGAYTPSEVCRNCANPRYDALPRYDQHGRRLTPDDVRQRIEDGRHVQQVYVDGDGEPRAVVVREATEQERRLMGQLRALVAETRKAEAADAVRQTHEHDNLDDKNSDI